MEPVHREAIVIRLIATLIVMFVQQDYLEPVVETVANVTDIIVEATLAEESELFAQ